MADVYTFRVKLSKLEKYIWRDIEITSVATVAKLGYTIIAAFEGIGSHLFNIEYNKKRYEIVFGEDYLDVIEIVDPIRTKLAALKLEIGNKLRMKYDYGAGWEFKVELRDIREMKKGSGNKYPCITAGAGRGIIEDTSPYELVDIVKKIEKTGKPFSIHDYFFDEKMEWDYRDFSLNVCNVGLRDKVRNIQTEYESYFDRDE